MRLCAKEIPVLFQWSTVEVACNTNEPVEIQVTQEKASQALAAKAVWIPNRLELLAAAG